MQSKRELAVGSQCRRLDACMCHFSEEQHCDDHSAVSCSITKRPWSLSMQSCTLELVNGTIKCLFCSGFILAAKTKAKSSAGRRGSLSSMEFADRPRIVLLSAPESPELSPSLFIPLKTDRKLPRTWGCLCIHGSYTCSEDLPIAIFREEGIASTGLSVPSQKGCM